MDAETIYRLMKPQLSKLNSSEKKTLSRLITSLPPQKISRQHRRVISLSGAKQKLREACLQEIQIERQARSI